LDRALDIPGFLRNRNMKNRCFKHRTESGILTSVFKPYTMMTSAHTTCIIIIIIIIIKLNIRYARIWNKIFCITSTTKQSRHLSGSQIRGVDAQSEVSLDSPPCKDGMCQDGHC
jgi:hypothetical protein